MSVPANRRPSWCSSPPRNEYEAREKLFNALQTSTVSKMCFSLGIPFCEENRFSRPPVWPFYSPPNDTLLRVALLKKPRKILRESQSAKAAREQRANELKRITPLPTTNETASSEQRVRAQSSRTVRRTPRIKSPARLTSTPGEQRGAVGGTHPWKASRQALRLDQEKRLLDACRSMKRTSQIMGHRTDPHYLMAGNALTLKPRYQVDERQLQSLKQLPAQPDKRPSIKTSEEGEPSHPSSAGGPSTSEAVSSHESPQGEASSHVTTTSEVDLEQEPSQEATSPHRASQEARRLRRMSGSLLLGKDALPHIEQRLSTGEPQAPPCSPEPPLDDSEEPPFDLGPSDTEKANEELLSSSVVAEQLVSALSANLLTEMDVETMQTEDAKDLLSAGEELDDFGKATAERVMPAACEQDGSEVKDGGMETAGEVGSSGERFDRSKANEQMEVAADTNIRESPDAALPDGQAVGVDEKLGGGRVTDGSGRGEMVMDATGTGGGELVGGVKSDEQKMGRATETDNPERADGMESAQPIQTTRTSSPDRPVGVAPDEETGRDQLADSRNLSDGPRADEQIPRTDEGKLPGGTEINEKMGITQGGEDREIADGSKSGKQVALPKEIDHGEHPEGAQFDDQIGMAKESDLQKRPGDRMSEERKRVSREAGGRGFSSDAVADERKVLPKETDDVKVSCGPKSDERIGLVNEINLGAPPCGPESSEQMETTRADTRYPEYDGHIETVAETDDRKSSNEQEDTSNEVSERMLSGDSTFPKQVRKAQLVSYRDHDGELKMVTKSPPKGDVPAAMNVSEEGKSPETRFRPHSKGPDLRLQVKAPITGVTESMLKVLEKEMKSKGLSCGPEGQMKYLIQVVAPDPTCKHSWQVQVGYGSAPSPPLLSMHGLGRETPGTKGRGALGHAPGAEFGISIPGSYLQTSKQLSTLTGSALFFATEAHEVNEILHRLQVDKKALLLALDPSLTDVVETPSDFECDAMGPMTQRLVKLAFIIGTKLGRESVPRRRVDAAALLNMVKIIRELAIASPSFFDNDAVDQILAHLQQMSEKSILEMDDEEIAQLIRQLWMIAEQNRGKEDWYMRVFGEDSDEALHAESDNRSDFFDYDSTPESTTEDDSRKRKVIPQRFRGYSYRWGYTIPEPGELPCFPIRNPPMQSLKKGIASGSGSESKSSSAATPAPAQRVKVSSSTVSARIKHINEVTTSTRKFPLGGIPGGASKSAAMARDEAAKGAPKALSLEEYLKALYNERKHRMYLKRHGWPGDYHRRDLEVLMPAEEERLVRSSLIRTMKRIRWRRAQRQELGLPDVEEDMYPNYSIDKSIHQPLQLVYRNSHTDASEKVPAHLVYYPKANPVSVSSMNARPYRKRVESTQQSMEASLARTCVRHCEFQHHSAALGLSQDPYSLEAKDRDALTAVPTVSITGLDLMRNCPLTTREKCMLGLYVEKDGPDALPRSLQAAEDGLLPARCKLDEELASDPDPTGQKPWINYAALKLEVMSASKLFKRALLTARRTCTMPDLTERSLVDELVDPPSMRTIEQAYNRRAFCRREYKKVWHIPQSMYEANMRPVPLRICDQPVMPTLAKLRVDGQQMCFF